MVEVVDVEIDETRVPAGPLELGSEDSRKLGVGKGSGKPIALTWEEVIITWPYQYEIVFQLFITVRNIRKKRVLLG